MDKVDFKITMKFLYDAPKWRFVRVDVPRLRYVMIDGQGDPNTAPAYKAAIEWLYPVSYAMKFASKLELGKDYVVPPLEGCGGPTIPRTSSRAARIAGAGP